MHPRTNTEYQKKITGYFKSDYSNNLIEKQGSEELDKLYEKLKYKAPSKTLFIVYGIGLPMLFISKDIMKIPREKSWIRYRGSHYIPVLMTFMAVGWFYEIVFPLKKCALDIAFKYEDQLIKLHPDLIDYYTENNFEPPK